MADEFDIVFKGGRTVFEGSDLVKGTTGAENLKDDFDGEPIDGGDFQYGDFQLVGHGKVTNVFCGKYLKLRGCLRADLHDMITLDGVNYKGKVYAKPVHHFCNKPSCPVCFLHGWAIREAGNIERRLAEAGKCFGLVEHVVCSVPVRDYGLSYKYLRKKAAMILYECGVIGGVLIFHVFRYNLVRHWYFSPHFHVLGFILGGYSRCRHCKGADCYSCDGVEGRCYKVYQRTGYIVRVLDKRKTVKGTAWYQLNHSSIDTSRRRFHVATWFGVCSYRKLRVTVEKLKALCPICRHELDDICYFGSKVFVTDRSSPDYKGSFFADLMEDGRVVWGVSVKNGSGSPKSRSW
jgi:hypothetical protein